MARVKITINRKTFEEDVEPRLLLVSYIREKARLTGTHIGCDTGHCGACTVLLDGRPIKSCMKLAISVDRGEITTIEGLAEGGLHPVQEAFKSHFAIQCGYCTPGMLLSSHALLQKNPEPDEPEIRHALVGNLCMCTGYQQIVDAVSHAAEQMKGKDRVIDED
jgi:carbon-monoxide dehydrogenase small subunit